MKNISQYRELLISLGIFWVITLYFLFISLVQNQGHIIYILDDSYIHMAMAKNFAKYGTWGVNKDKFTSTSSSLLYTLLLSFSYFIAGVNDFAPLILNLLFANLLIYIVYFILKKENFPPYIITISLLSIIICVPLPTMIMYGMELTLQILISLVFLYFVSKILANNQIQEKISIFSKERLLLLIAPLVTMIRFEGMFLIITAFALFILKRKFVYSLLLGTFGFIPILIYGLISVSNGWNFFPNSIIIKSNLLNFQSPNFFLDSIQYIIYKMNTILHTLQHHVLISCLFVTAITIFFFKGLNKKEIWNESSVMSILFVITLLFQAIFASIGYTYIIYYMRYDAYLIALGIFMILFSIKEYIPPKISFNFFKEQIIRIKKEIKIFFILKVVLIGAISLLTLISLISRGFNLLFLTPQASKNIYEQQYQMGLFLKTYYNGKCVAANDIGAINYLSDIECLDLVGLSDIEVLNAMQNGIYYSYKIYDLAKEKNCKIAILYDFWFYKYGGIPSKWIKVGEWTIVDNVVCARDTVSFYAVDPKEKDQLISNLKEFSTQLPEDILQAGIYTL